MDTRVNSRQRRSSSSGATLVEALLVILFLTVLAIGLLQLLTQSLLIYTRLERQRNSTVEAWNKTRAARLSRPAEASFFYPCATCRPLYRWSVEGPNKQEWEVICAEK